MITAYDASQDRMKVFVFDDQNNYMALDGSWIQRSTHGEAQPFMSIPTMIWTALEREIMQLHQEPATERHLNDVVHIRDRLLTLLEVSHHRALDSLPRRPR